MIDKKLIETLARSEMFQTYERAYTEAIEMPLTLRPVQTRQLSFHGKRNENAFCAVMAEMSRTCAACLQLQEKLAQAAMNGPATRTCAYGLCETAVPVKLGHQTIGFLQTGQAMRQKPTEASFQRAVKQAAKRGANIDNKKTKRAYFKTPVSSRRKLDSVSNLLAVFADHLAMKSSQIVTQTENAEAPFIVKATQFIREHYTEDLSLGQVSNAVKMSPSYFSKVFHKRTAVTFSEFVSRIRVEKAKNYLLNPNLRVSEIAFAVGFQSPTHFNRMFKRIVGQSPSEYHAALPSTA